MRGRQSVYGGFTDCRKGVLCLQISIMDASKKLLIFLMLGSSLEKHGGKIVSRQVILSGPVQQVCE